MDVFCDFSEKPGQTTVLSLLSTVAKFQIDKPLEDKNSILSFEGDRHFQSEGA